MKVLMFGWEFPPHISGGLGTACYGLTRALIKNHTEVLFVVPRLSGDESREGPLLIDASRHNGKPETQSSTTTIPTSPAESAASPDKIYRVVEQHRVTRIEVPSTLMPYYHPGKQTIIQSWNYSFYTEEQKAGPEKHTAPSGHSHNTIDTDDDDATFTGTYGANLMDEVARYARVAASIARKYSFDVIHAHDWMTIPAGIEARRVSGKPLIVHVHSTEIDRAGEHVNKAVFETEMQGFRQADRLIAVSNWTRTILVSRYGIAEDKVTVVHNGISSRGQGQQFLFPDISSHFVTFLGRVTYQKGPNYFVEAARQVLQEFPDAHFIVAGAGDLLPQIITRVAQLNMSANFHFTGFLSGNQVDQVWSLSDVYVMPSVSEPFGIAPLEAIQRGVPVILSKQSGVSEVMPHAIVVDFWNTKALAAAICSVLRYESLSHVLRQNSKRHLKHLTWEKAAEEVKAVYHEFIER